MRLIKLDNKLDKQNEGFAELDVDAQHLRCQDVEDCPNHSILRHQREEFQKTAVGASVLSHETSCVFHKDSKVAVADRAGALVRLR